MVVSQFENLAILLNEMGIAAEEEARDGVETVRIPTMGNAMVVLQRTGTDVFLYVRDESRVKKTQAWLLNA